MLCYGCAYGIGVVVMQGVGFQPIAVFGFQPIYIHGVVACNGGCMPVYKYAVVLMLGYIYGILYVGNVVGAATRGCR